MEYMAGSLSGFRLSLVSYESHRYSSADRRVTSHRLTLNALNWVVKGAVYLEPMGGERGCVHPF